MAYTQEQKDQILQRLNNTYGADAVNNLTNQIQSGNTQQAKATANQMKQNTQQTTTTNTQTQNNTNFNNSNGTNGQNNQQNTQYDPNEQFDSSMIGENKGVSVKEGTAQVTGKPDYQATSDARMQEITNNLNSYYATNKEYFADRSTFNSIFDYDQRDVSQQKLLDSYRKKVENQNKTSGYTTGDSITQGMNNGEITTDMWNYIKEYNQDAYNQWQQSQQEKIDQMIANMSAPADPESTADSLQKLVDKLNIQAGDPYDLIGQRESYMESTGANNTLRELQGTVAEMKTKQKEYEAIVSKYSNTSSWGLGGAAANNARMLKALAPVTESFSMLAQTYSTQNTLYSTQMATANQAVSVMQAQAQEDQRVFNQKLSALGFAMEVNSYRTPEQQAQLQLQTQQISNEMSLLNQSKMNDLSLYNQYATAKMQNQLAFELTDLNVSDKEQAKRNLNNVLSEYYSQYGDIIQRSQSQALQDIMDYAEKNGCSVAEALTKNFIEPLQSKSEYKAMVRNNYKTGSSQSLTTINGKQAILTQNADGTLRIDYIDEDTVGNMEDFLSKYKEGDKGGQCGKFVNDYLESMGLERIFQNDISQKLSVSETYNPESVSVGDVVVFDYSNASSASHISDNSKKYGHVAIVTDIDRSTGKMTITESNYDGNETVHTREVDMANPFLKGMYSPSGANNSGANIEINGTTLNTGAYKGWDNLTYDEQQTVIGLLDYSINPASISKSGKDNGASRTRVIAAANAIGKDIGWNEGKFSQADQYIKKWNTKVVGGDLSRNATAVSILKNLSEDYSALNNSDIQKVNSWINGLKSQFGDDITLGVQSDIAVAATEIAGALKGGASPTTEEIADMKKILNGNMSQAQANEVFRRFARNLLDKNMSEANGYLNVVGTKPYSPYTQEVTDWLYHDLGIKEIPNYYNYEGGTIETKKETENNQYRGGYTTTSNYSSNIFTIGGTTYNLSSMPR